MVGPQAEQAPSLHGLRILDLTRLLPGAYATLLLAEGDGAHCGEA